MLATTPDIGAAPVARTRDESPIKVDRWPSEMPLVFLVAIISLAIWAVAAITIIGLVYAALLGAIFFVGHAVFVSHVRGNGVRLGPDQFPELQQAVERLSQRMGLAPVPETYLMQHGGTLNAFAAKLFRSNIVVLFSELIEACGDDDGARDMIIAHELGHIRAGHLRWSWLLLPGSLVPFLGNALSRAREYTCDRYGMAGAGRRDSALVGLAILAAGGAHGPRVNREAMVRQREHLNTGWMRIGEWLSTHPPLTHRMAALDPALDALSATSSAGTVRALAIILTAAALPVGAAVVMFSLIMGAANMAAARASAGDSASIEQLLGQRPTPSARPTQYTRPAPVEALPVVTNVGEELSKIQVSVDMMALAGVLEMERAKGALPADTAALYAKVTERHPGDPEPRDGFGGQRYKYEQQDGFYVLRSAGPDGRHGTADDIVRDSRRQ